MKRPSIGTRGCSDRVRPSARSGGPAPASAARITPRRPPLPPSTSMRSATGTEHRTRQAVLDAGHQRADVAAERHAVQADLRESGSWVRIQRSVGGCPTPPAPRRAHRRAGPGREAAPLVLRGPCSGSTGKHHVQADSVCRCRARNSRRSTAPRPIRAPCTDQPGSARGGAAPGRARRGWRRGSASGPGRVCPGVAGSRYRRSASCIAWPRMVVGSTARRSGYRRVVEAPRVVEPAPPP